METRADLWLRGVIITSSYSLLLLFAPLPVTAVGDLVVRHSPRELGDTGITLSFLLSTHTLNHTFALCGCPARRLAL